MERQEREPQAEIGADTAHRPLAAKGRMALHSAEARSAHRRRSDSPDANSRRRTHRDRNNRRHTVPGIRPTSSKLPGSLRTIPSPIPNPAAAATRCRWPAPTTGPLVAVREAHTAHTAARGRPARARPAHRPARSPARCCRKRPQSKSAEMNAPDLSCVVAEFPVNQYERLGGKAQPALYARHADVWESNKERQPAVPRYARRMGCGDWRRVWPIRHFPDAAGPPHPLAPTRRVTATALVEPERLILSAQGGSTAACAAVEPPWVRITHRQRP